MWSVYFLFGRWVHQQDRSVQRGVSVIVSTPVRVDRIIETRLSTHWAWWHNSKNTQVSWGTWSTHHGEKGFDDVRGNRWTNEWTFCHSKSMIMIIVFIGVIKGTVHINKQRTCKQNIRLLQVLKYFWTTEKYKVFLSTGRWCTFTSFIWHLYLLCRFRYKYNQVINGLLQMSITVMNTWMHHSSNNIIYITLTWASLHQEYFDFSYLKYFE